MFSKINSLPDHDFIYQINKVIIILSIFLIRLPIALGYRYNIVYRGLGIIPVVATVIFNILFIHRNHTELRVDKKGFVVFSLFIIIWIESILRSAFHEISFDTFYFIQNLIDILMLIVFVITALWANPDPVRQFQLKKGLLFAFGLYISMNVVFYFIGIDAHDSIYLTSYPSQMLGFLHIKASRVLFPMADGINGFGLLTGAVLVGHFRLLNTNVWKKEKIISFCLVVICVFVILLTDSRGALVFSIISILIMYFHQKFYKLIRWSPIIFPFISLFVVFLASKFTVNIPSWLVRPNSSWSNSQITYSNQLCQELLHQTNGIFSNRPVIWSVVLSELMDIKPIHLVGYGFRGQVMSNISANYSCLFSSYTDSLLASAHNIWLQFVLDVGYLGLIMTMGLLYYLLLHLPGLISISKGYFYLAIEGILLYILFIGTIEAPLSPDFFCIFIMVIFICLATLIRDSDQTTNKEIMKSMIST
jgi:hypothetical protein